MLATTCFCPTCHRLYTAWTHDPAAVLSAYPRTPDGFIVLSCLACEGLVIYAAITDATLPAWLEDLIKQQEPETLNQVVLRTSPLDNLAREYPHLFADLDDDPLTEALTALSEVQS